MLLTRKRFQNLNIYWPHVCILSPPTQRQPTKYVLITLIINDKVIC